MASIKPYEKNGKTFYKFQLYIGTDPLTGKVRKTTRRGFKTKKEAQLELARLQLEIDKGTYVRHRLKLIAKYMIYGLCNMRTL